MHYLKKVKARKAASLVKKALRISNLRVGQKEKEMQCLKKRLRQKNLREK